MTRLTSLLFCRLTLILVAASVLAPEVAHANACRAAIFMLTNDIPRARTPPATKTLSSRALEEWICAIRRLDRAWPISLVNVREPLRPFVTWTAQYQLDRLRSVLEAFYQRPGAEVGQTEFERISRTDFVRGMEDATSSLFGQLNDQKVYFYIDKLDSENQDIAASNRWAFHVMFDAIRSIPSFAAKVNILEPGDLRGVDPLTVRRIVYVDDHAASATDQGRAIARAAALFPNLLDVNFLIPFMTAGARTNLDNKITEINQGLPYTQPPILPHFPPQLLQVPRLKSLADIFASWQQMPVNIRPIANEDDMALFFGPDWRALTLTIFDHGIPDSGSAAAFRTGREDDWMPIFAGPIPAFRNVAEVGSWLPDIRVMVRVGAPRTIPFVLNLYDAPTFPNQADTDLIRGGMFRYPARPNP